MSHLALDKDDGWCIIHGTELGVDELVALAYLLGVVR
jgi:hypothetical protein